MTSTKHSEPSVPVTAGEREIDYDNPQFNQGVTHVVEMLSETIGAEGWVAGDGSEDYDDDLRQTLLNILAAKNLYDHDTATYAALPCEVPDGWRTMDSAPKDGTKFLAADESGDVDTAAFDGVHCRFITKTEQLNRTGFVEAWPLTHWRPLPAPPSASPAPPTLQRQEVGATDADYIERVIAWGIKTMAPGNPSPEEAAKGIITLPAVLDVFSELERLRALQSRPQDVRREAE